MTTETETEPKTKAEADAEGHQQAHGSHDGDGVDCLHCRLMGAFDAWVDARQAANEGVNIGLVGVCIGTTLAQIGARFTALGPVATKAFVQGMVEGQVAYLENQRGSEDPIPDPVDGGIH